jgi:hypothetical protein
MFGNLMMTLDSIKDDVEFVNDTLINNYPAILSLLQDYPHHENKIAVSSKELMMESLVDEKNAQLCHQIY